MAKFIVPLQKDLLQVGEVLFLITGGTSCLIQVILSDVYDLVIMQHGRVVCMRIVNGDRHLVMDI